jgi:dienelactone hydrolase
VKTVRALLVLGAVLAGLANAQTEPPSPVRAPSDRLPLAVDLQERIERVTVTVKDRQGREQTQAIPVTVYRPPGAGPFPLVVFNHGRAVDRSTQGRSRPEHLARYLVQKGLVVMAPTRLGYGDTHGAFDPEDSGPCERKELAPAAQAAADQVLATVAHARQHLPFVDAGRWVVMGTSMGGNATLATVRRQPRGLLGGVNFGAGSGANPALRPGQPCSPERFGQQWSGAAVLAQAPTLWLYWHNDLYNGAEWPARWREAWVQGGGQAEFHALSAVGSDGHGGVFIDMNRWVPLMEPFLARLGVGSAHAPVRHRPAPDADLSQPDRLPANDALRQAYAQRFLTAALPRAFAVGDRGAFGVFSGDWAEGRALGLCQRSGQTCRLYAVDHDVVEQLP